MPFIYTEIASKEGPRFFTPYHKQNAVAGYLTHYGNYLYLNFIAHNELATNQERKQANREILIAERKMNWWAKHPNYVQQLVDEGKHKLNRQWKK